MRDTLKTSKRSTYVVKSQLRHLSSFLSMIVIKVHRDGAVCARISLLPVQQNNIIIDCFVCDRSAWCLLQAAAQSPPTGDVGHCCLQVQVENCGGCWKQFVDPNAQRPRPLRNSPPALQSRRVSAGSVLTVTVSTGVFFSLQVGDFSAVGMTDTPPSDCPTQGAEFDMMSALDWKDGIATLPGSDIRVRNKFAILSAFVPMPS